MFPFHGNIIFSELSFKRKCKKAASFCNAYSGVDMKFSYMIAVRKDEIFYVVFLRKQAISHLRLRQLFDDDIYVKRSNLLRPIAAKISHWSTFVENVFIFFTNIL